MQCLLFSGETPDHGGYQVCWNSEAPSVEQCRPHLDSLSIHDWSRQETHSRSPEVERLSWRVIDSEGRCRARHDAEDQTRSERAWLASVDLQLEHGDLRARDAQALLVLIAGTVRVELDPHLRELLQRTGNFVDYRLEFLGPDGRALAEAPDPGQGDYRLLEKHEAFVVPA